MKHLIDFNLLNHGPKTKTYATGFLLLLILAMIYVRMISGKPKLFSSSNKKEVMDFSEVPALSSFDIALARPHPYRPWKAGKYHMTMGIRKMPEAEWLVLDNAYMQEQQLRKHLLETKRTEVLQYLPGSEEACAEALECIVGFLLARYPSQFKLLKERPGHIHNLLTGQIFKIEASYMLHPLEIAAQLIMEDINILIEGEGDDPDYHLQASYSMAPAGWYLKERIGYPLWKIHGPVPIWDPKLRKPIKKFFRNLDVSSPVERNNFFLQTNDILFQQEPFAARLAHAPKIDEIRIRHERQTLRRLPQSGAIIFMVRTYMTPVTELSQEKENLKTLLEAVKAWPPPMAKYKSRHVWLPTLEAWSREVLANYSCMPEVDVHKGVPPKL